MGLGMARDGAAEGLSVRVDVERDVSCAGVWNDGDSRKENFRMVRGGGVMYAVCLRSGSGEFR